MPVKKNGVENENPDPVDSYREDAAKDM